MGIITSEILDLIDVLEESPTSDWSTILAKVSWSGKEPKGLDIRKYDGKNVYKGISLSEDALRKLCKVLIKNGFIEKEECLEIFGLEKDKPKKDIKKEELFFDVSDFERMFKEVAEEGNYTRDDDGYLRNDRGYVAILRREYAYDSK